MLSAAPTGALTPESVPIVPQAGQIFTVTNTNDSGAESLRQAILDANATAGEDSIAFTIAGSGVKTISPTSALPAITDPVLLDGTTQPGFAGTPLIELSGLNAGAGAHGLTITSSGSTVLGLNIDRFSGSGIVVTGTGSTGNRIQSNQIFDNGGLGIDLGNDGVTANDPNDPDTGPNQRQNFPFLVSAADTTVRGTLDAAPNSVYQIDLFSNLSADPSGNGEGQIYLGAVAVTTDATGNGGFTATIANPLTVGQFVTATATDALGNTSEFSRAFAVATAPLTVRINGSGLGAVTSLPVGINLTANDATEVYPQNTVVTLTATPGQGSTFLGWSGFGITSRSPTLDLTLSQAMTVTATFVPVGTVLTVTAGLSPANETDLYQFDAQAGDHLLYTIISAPAGGAAPTWRLIDPFSAIVSSGSFSPGQIAIDLQQSGTYTLSLEGQIVTGQPGAYTFSLDRPTTTPPPPPAGTPYTLGATVTDTVASATPDTYLFTLAAPAQVFFDSLTNSTSVTATLTGPRGTEFSNRFFQSDGFGNAVLSLPAGSYQFKVTTTSQTAQPYSFRLLDLAAGTPLTFGQLVSGALSPGNETDVHRFTASAGQRLYFDAQAAGGSGTVGWRLVDPFGGERFFTNFFVGSLSDIEPAALSADGLYTLLLEGSIQNTGPITYSFIVYGLDETPQPLTLNSTVDGSIAVPGEQDRYTFALAGATQLYFDSLTNSNSLTWTLTGPPGAVVTNRALSGSDGNAIAGNPVVSLPAGDYTLILDGNTDATGAYSFRMLDLAAAAPLTLGAPVSGSLSPANETDAYQITTTVPNQSIFFDLQARSGAGSAFLRIADPFGRLVPLTTFSAQDSTSFGSDLGPLTLNQPGAYTLLLEGAISDTTPGTYAFTMHAVTDEAIPLVFTSTITDAIDEPGEQDRYTFTLAGATPVLFDSLTNNGSLTWTLTGPAGAIVTARSFATFSETLVLGAGDYSLTIDAFGDATPAYSFRLLDLSVGAMLTLGQPVSGTLSPGAEADVYQFTGTAGQRLFLDAQTSNGGFLDWRLVDPFGQNRFNVGFADQEPAALTATGLYTLVLDGFLSNSTPVNYTFAVHALSDTQQPLSLNTAVSSSISVPGEQDRYTFTLADAAQLYFDSLTSNSNLTWTLTGPPGTVINARTFTNSEGASVSTPILALPAGDYTLTIDGVGDVIGAYSFRLVDLATATSLTGGTPVTGSLSPTNETDLYQFTTVAANQVVYFDVQARTGANSAVWRLVDPFGQMLFVNSANNATNLTFSSDVGPLTLSQPGNYTLLLEGSISDTTPGTYTFNVQPVTDETIPLVLNMTITEAIDEPGEQDHYTFTLTGDTQLLFDSLTNNNSLTWSLTGPAGAIVTARSFSTGVNDTLVLGAGDYSLAIDVSGDATPTYSFRLLDLSAGTPLTLGTPVTSTLTPGNETDVYRFTGAAGQPLFFDVTSSSGGSAGWRLIDPFGQERFNTNFVDQEPAALAATGLYALVVDGFSANSTPVNYSFAVHSLTVQAPAPPQPMTVNSIVSGSLGVGQSQTYTFTVPSQTLGFYDALTDNPGFTVAFVSPGSVGDFPGPFNEEGFGVVRAGTHSVTIRATGGASGLYSFRLVDLATATPLTFPLAGPISGALTPGTEADFYRFTAAAGDRFDFDAQSLTGGAGIWTLIDPFGEAVFSDNLTIDQLDVGLEFAGTYTLAIQGDAANANPGTVNYTADIVFLGNTPPPVVTGTPIVFGSTMTGNLATAGQVDTYTFTLTGDTVVSFDALTNKSELRWSIEGPSIFAVDQPFAFEGPLSFGVQETLPAGDYLFRVSASSGAPGTYSFRLSTPADATPLTLPALGAPGATTNGTLNPGNETDLYRFTANAGDRLYFDAQSGAGSLGLGWRLVSPIGETLFAVGSFIDGLTNPLPATGDYVLGIAGGLNNPGAINYSFRLLPVAEAASGVISVPGEQDQDAFTLTQPTQLFFDMLSNSGSAFRATLTGPRGIEFSNRSFAQDLVADSVMNLPEGYYSLTVDATGDTTGFYAYRLLDLASAMPLSFGQQVNSVLAPGNETDAYRFTGTAGQRLYFDAQSGSPLSWQLVDPFGKDIFNTAGSSYVDQQPAALTAGGTYTLLINGSIAASAAVDYSFTVHEIVDSIQPVSLNSVVTGTLGVGQKQTYSLTVPTQTLGYFDPLTNNTNFTVLFVDPGSSGNTPDPFAQNSFGVVAPGAFTVTVDGTGDTSGGYSFRLLDLASATPLTLPLAIPVSGALSPGTMTDLYRFEANAGDRFTFDAQALSGGGGAWTLIDPFGAPVFTVGLTTDQTNLTLNHTGAYTLAIEGAITNANPGTVNYTFNILFLGNTPPAPVTGTSIAFGTTISGNLSTAGQTDTYTFTLTGDTVVSFDALTNNGALRWSLIGPSINAVDQPFFQEGPIRLGVQDTLPAGDYVFRVSASSGSPGAYSFRLLTPDIATPLTLPAPGVLADPINGTLNPGNEVDLYRFTASTGDRFYFDQLTGSSGAIGWRLVSPLGQDLFTSTNFFDVEPLAVPATGSYVLAVFGFLGNPSPVNYSVRVQPLNDAPQPLTVNSTINGSLAVPGEQDRYTFTLAAPTSVFFDSQTNSSAITATLTGPRGTEFNNRSLAFDLGANMVVPLPTGSYTLTIDGNTDATGVYAFQMLDVAAGTPLTFGQPVNGTLSPGNETDAYRFTATAGQRLYFDAVTGSSSNLRWRLVDPFGKELFNTVSTGFFSDQGPLTLTATGTYALTIDGVSSNSAATTYSFAVHDVVDSLQPLTLNSAVNGGITVPFEQDQYTFTLAAPTQLFFDSLTNDGSLRATLTGPRGTEFSNRTFSGDLPSNSVLSLSAGSYTLTIDASNSATGVYAFRLLDLASGTPLTLGTPVNGTLSPGNETDVYRFSATAGQRLYFDALSSSSTTNPYVRVVDPLGKEIFNSATSSGRFADLESPALMISGTYSLLVDGLITNGTPVDYSIALYGLVDSQQPLTLNSPINGSLSVPGEQDRYTFALAEPTPALFDSQTNNGNLMATLTGPRGTEFTNRSLSGDLGANTVRVLPAGSYTLTIDGILDSTGAYTFQMLDLAAGTPLTLGTPVNATLSPGNETDVYRFAATAGQRLYFDAQTFNAALNWRLVDPFGQEFFNTGAQFQFSRSFADQEPAVLTATGFYALTIDGLITNTTPVDYSFTVYNLNETPQTVILNSAINSAISAPGERDRYTFTLANDIRLYFDGQTNNSSLTWTLTGPPGTVVNARNFTTADGGGSNTSSVLDLPAGDYTLTVDGSGDSTPSYTFRLFDLATASVIPAFSPLSGDLAVEATLTPGTPVTGELSPANETDVYQFTTTAPNETFYFDIQARDGASSARWQLIDPSNRLLFDSGFNANLTDVGPLTLSLAGTYTLLLEGAVQDTVPGTYTFNVQPVTDETFALTLNQPMTDAIDEAGERDVYTFTLAAPAQLVFDSQTNNGNITATLTGPRGTEINARRFDADFFLFSNSILPLPVGDYTLTVDASGDTTGSYTFQMLDLAAATPLTLGTQVNGMLSPGNETDTYRFTATAGQRLYFDVQAVAGFQSSWRLADPFGKDVFNRSFDANADHETTPLTAAGEYTLAINGNSSNGVPAAYTFTASAVLDTAQPLTLNSLVSASIAAPGQQDRYVITLGETTRLYFDSLTNSSTLTWSVSGQPGTLVNARPFQSSDAIQIPNPVLTVPAGLYTLTIDGTGDATGAYAFRLLDLAAAPVLSLGVPVVTFPEAKSFWPGTITFSWTPVVPSAAQVLVGYNVYVGVSPGQYGTPIFVPSSETSLTLNDLPPVPHFFSVTALTTSFSLLPLSTADSALGPQSSVLTAEAAGPSSPVAVPDLYATPKGFQFATVATTGLLRNDQDADRDPLVAELVTGPAQGALVAFNADGSFLYKPAAGFIGADSFTYRAKEASGTKFSAPVTVTIVNAQESGFSVEVVASPKTGLNGWTIVDEGAVGGPSNWTTSVSPVYGQLSPIGPGTDPTAAQRGTHLFLTDGLPQGRVDYQFTFSLRSTGSGALGLMFRYTDPNNYYRISMDRDPNQDGNAGDGYRRLIKVQNGVATTLMEEAGAALGGPAYEIDEVYQVELTTVGESTSIRITDSLGRTLVDWSVQDGSLVGGGIALYSARNPGSFYDLISVQSMARPDPKFVGLEVHTSGLGLGTVTSSFGSGVTVPGSPASLVPIGTSVVLTATPGPGFTFGGWKQGEQVISTAPQLPVTVNDFMIVEAVFNGNPLPSVTLDLLGRGDVSADVEGKTILRYLSGVPDSQLASTITAGLAPSATITKSPAEIRSFLDAARNTLLDVDGNGQNNPFTDGRLLYRFLQQREQGQTGPEADAALLQGAVIGPNAKRGVTGTISERAAEIRSFLSRYLPPPAAQPSSEAGLRTEDSGLSGEFSVVSSQLSASNLEPQMASAGTVISDQSSVSSSSASTTPDSSLGTHDSSLDSTLSPQSSALSTTSVPPLTPDASRLTVPMGFAATFSVQAALADDTDSTPLTAASSPWLSDFVVSSAVADDPNRDVAVTV